MGLVWVLLLSGDFLTLTNPPLGTFRKLRSTPRHTKKNIVVRGKWKNMQTLPSVNLSQQTLLKQILLQQTLLKQILSKHIL